MTLTPQEQAELRGRHLPSPFVNKRTDGKCKHCLVPWPCDAAKLLDALEAAEAVRDSRAEQAAKWMDRAGLLLKERDEILDKLEKVEYHLVELCEVAGRLTGMSYEEIAKIERPSSEARARVADLAGARRESRNLLRKRS